MILIEWTDGFRYAVGIDATSMYGFEHTAETTDRVVDAGAHVTDHIRSNPITGTLEGIITNSPLRALAPTRDRVAGVRSVQLQDKTSVNVLAWDTDFDRVRQTDELLQQLMESKALVKLTTGFRVIENLAVTRYSAKRDENTGNGIAVTMELKQIRFAVSQRASVTPIVRRAIPPQQRGAQPVDNRTGLARIEDGVSGLVSSLMGR
jgi:hypothetical protein